MNGFILVNKQKDVSSNFVVQEIKKKIKAKKVGHTGTLDPLASGLLVLAIDRATKFSSYFLESNKSYDVEVSLGISTVQYLWLSYGSPLLICGWTVL